MYTTNVGVEEEGPVLRGYEGGSKKRWRKIEESTQMEWTVCHRVVGIKLEGSDRTRCE